MQVIAREVSAEERRQEINDLAEKRYQGLKTQAYFEPGISDNCELNNVPSWFDASKYKRCMYLARKYFVSLYMAHFIGLLMIIQIPSGLAPLLATGNSSTVAKLFRRYLSTLIHIKSWYESDPFDSSSGAFKSMQKVRAMHRRVQHMMNNRPKSPTAKDKLWLNQYDFVMTQWAFIGPIILYKTECGLKPASDEDMDHIYYLWRVIGYCIGIEDKYNLCSGDIEVDRELCRLLLERDYRPVLQASDIDNNMGWHMGNGIATALRMLNPSISFEAFINYWYPILELPHKPLLNTVFLKFSYYWMLFNFHVMLRFSVGHWLYGMAYRFLIALAVKRKQIREIALKNRYKDLKYEVKCPLESIDIGYEDAFDRKKMNL